MPAVRKRRAGGVCDLSTAPDRVGTAISRLPLRAGSTPDYRDRVEIRVRDGALEDVDGVARVWADATAARDGDLPPARLEIAREPILSVMREDGYLLIVVAAPRIVAFALATPAASEPLERASPSAATSST